jgi:hypothetical protein
MGAVCYKPKPAVITREDILRALNDKFLRETIHFGDDSEKPTPTNPLGVASGLTLETATKATTTMGKTEDQQSSNATTTPNNKRQQRMMTGGRLTPHLQMDTIADNAANNSLNISKSLITPGITSRTAAQAFTLITGTAFKSSR